MLPKIEYETNILQTYDDANWEYYIFQYMLWVEAAKRRMRV